VFHRTFALPVSSIVSMVPSKSAIFPYCIRPTSESSVSVEIFGRGLRLRKRVFFFERFTGGLDYNFEQPESSKAMLIIETDSVTCRDELLSVGKRKKLVAQVKDELLQSATFPQIVFTSERIRQSSQHRFDFQGTLTICGKSRPVTVDVAAIVTKHRVELDANAVVKMSDYRMQPSRSLTGIFGVKDAVSLRCLLWPEKPLDGK